MFSKRHGSVNTIALIIVYLRWKSNDWKIGAYWFTNCEADLERPWIYVIACDEELGTNRKWAYSIT